MRSASASAGDLASLSAANTAGSVESENGNSSNGDNMDGEHSNKFNHITLALSNDNKDGDLQERFQLLNSPLLPSERNVWELATDAMLQDIYGNAQTEGSDAEMAAPSSVASTDVTDVSAGSSPFDLVDLDIEIEEPLQLNISLDEHEAVNGYGQVKTEPGMDWSGLFASLVA